MKRGNTISKRYTDTEIWHEDWFLDMPVEYQHFYKYIKDRCDHAGIWRPNKRIFEASTGLSIDLEEARKLLNDEKERIRVLESGKWLMVGFYDFQYGHKINMKNKVHASIFKIYEKEGVDLSYLRGDIEVVGGEENKKVKKINGKKHYAEAVYMSAKQYDTLVFSHGKFYTEKAIYVLDKYKNSNGKTYKSDYHAILAWVMEKVKKEFPVSQHQDGEKDLKLNRRGLEKMSSLTKGIG